MGAENALITEHRNSVHLGRKKPAKTKISSFPPLQVITSKHILSMSAMGIGLRSTLHAIKTLYPDMTHRATGIGSKSSLTIMAGATIFALIKRLHGEIIILFR